MCTEPFCLVGAAIKPCRASQNYLNIFLKTSNNAGETTINFRASSECRFRDAVFQGKRVDPGLCVIHFERSKRFSSVIMTTWPISGPPGISDRRKPLTAKTPQTFDFIGFIRINQQIFATFNMVNKTAFRFLPAEAKPGHGLKTDVIIW